MSRILIFGGTTEGRLLAEYCHEQKKSAWVSVATGYGKMVLPDSPYLLIHETPMNEEEMEQFILHNGITLVFDATHPYAAVVSKNIASACEKTETKRIRVVRESVTNKEDGGAGEHIIWVDSVEEAVRYLQEKAGNVLVTTGSKELVRFTLLDSFEERVYARILPTVAVISSCEEIGIKGKRLIGMQGPFSQELNEAMIRQYDINYLVTKEAGNAGGFQEKIKAAEACHIKAVVVGRPMTETGMTLKEAKEILFDYDAGDDVQVERRLQDESSIIRKVCLIGIGMGGPEQMTMQAVKALKESQVVFGADRMLKSIGDMIPGVKQIPWYVSRDILPWLEEHKEYRKVVILYSGDTGFYSGAKKMMEAFLAESNQSTYKTEILPGISSVSYLCSKLKTGWEDAKLMSLHGRQGDVAEELRKSDKVFALLDGNNTVKQVCSRLMEEGFGNVKLSVGERLSYPDERITTGTPLSLKDYEFDVLSAVWIER
jgi:precorrin-6x reductase